jgi:hypothetical protein
MNNKLERAKIEQNLAANVLLKMLYEQQFSLFASNFAYKKLCAFNVERACSTSTDKVAEMIIFSF